MNDDPKDDRDDASRSRRPYTAPQVTRVPLRLEEAVLGGCKTSGNLGPGGDCTALGGCKDLVS